MGLNTHRLNRGYCSIHFIGIARTDTHITAFGGQCFCQAKPIPFDEPVIKTDLFFNCRSIMIVPYYYSNVLYACDEAQALHIARQVRISGSKHHSYSRQAFKIMTDTKLVGRAYSTVKLHRIVRHITPGLAHFAFSAATHCSASAELLSNFQAVAISSDRVNSISIYISTMRCRRHLKAEID